MDLLRSYLRKQWDRVAAWGCIGVGAIVMLIGWVGVSGTAYPAEQTPYVISGGLVGLFLLGVGALFWLSADLRDEWRELHAINRRLQELEPIPGLTSRPRPELEPGALFCDEPGGRPLAQVDGPR
jgi:hypothetical protein